MKEFLAKLAENGIKAKDIGPTKVRFVTHKEINDDDINFVIERLSSKNTAIFQLWINVGGSIIQGKYIPWNHYRAIQTKTESGQGIIELLLEIISWVVGYISNREINKGK